MTTDAELVRAIAKRFLTKTGEDEIEQKLAGRNVLAAKMYLYGALETLVDNSTFPTEEIRANQAQLGLSPAEIARVKEQRAIFHS